MTRFFDDQWQDTTLPAKPPTVDATTVAGPWRVMVVCAFLIGFSVSQFVFNYDWVKWLWGGMLAVGSGLRNQ